MNPTEFISNLKTAEKYRSLTMKQLRDELKSRGLPTRGDKEILISHLLCDDNTFQYNNLVLKMDNNNGYGKWDVYKYEKGRKDCLCCVPVSSKKLEKYITNCVNQEMQKAISSYYGAIIHGH